jgi:hypothetical protein
MDSRPRQKQVSSDQWKRVKGKTPTEHLEWQNIPENQSRIWEVDQPFQLTRMLETFNGNCTTGFLFRARNAQALRQSNLLRRSLHPILEAVNKDKTGFHSFRHFRMTHLRKQIPRI